MYWNGESTGHPVPKNFESHVYCLVQLSPEWQQYIRNDLWPYTIDDFSACRTMHESMWEVHLTSRYEHPVLFRAEEPLELGEDALAILDWDHDIKYLHPIPQQRVLILLTRSDPRLRWLAVMCNGRKRKISAAQRTFRDCMLRMPSCCDGCALTEVRKREGNWVLIL